MPFRSLTLLLVLTAFPAGLCAQAATPPPDPQPTAADDRHPIADFGKDVLGDFKGLISTHNIAPAIIGGGLTGLSTLADDSVVDYFRDHPGGSWTRPGSVIGGAYSQLGVTAGLYLIGRRVKNRRFHDMSYSFARGMLVNIAVTGGVKLAARRERPNGKNNYAFPSGHSAGSFMAATVLTHYYGWRAALPSYAVAAYVGVTRLADNEHHLSDVIGGAAFGYIVAKTVCRRTDKLSTQRFSWSVTPVAGGAAASLSIQLPPGF